MLTAIFAVVVILGVKGLTAMALYRYAHYLSRNDDPAFDQENSPGTRARFSGIYRCMGCGREAACNQGDPLPPQNHHQHNPGQDAIRWKLIVYADYTQR